MSNTEQPFTLKNKKRAHAGDVPADQGGELPVKNYRKPLEDAAEEDLEVPGNLDTGFQHAPITEAEQNAAEAHRLKRQEEAEAETERKRTRRKRILIGIGAAAGAGLLATTLFVGKIINDMSDAVTDPTSPNQDPGVSGPAKAGENDADKVSAKPSWAKPELFGDSASYEDLKQPVVLTDNEKTTWESGTVDEKNNLASAKVAPSLGVALYDMVQAEKLGEQADISYLSDDPRVLEVLHGTVVEKFAEVSSTIDKDATETQMMQVCQTDIDYSTDVRCNPMYDNGYPTNFSPDQPLQFTVLRHTTDDFNAEVADNGQAFKYPGSMTLALDGDRLVLQTIDQ